MSSIQNSRYIPLLKGYENIFFLKMINPAKIKLSKNLKNEKRFLMSKKFNFIPIVKPN